MAERRKKIRGSTAALNGIAGLEGMFAFDRQLKEVRVYDGVTIGGFRIPNKDTNDAALSAVLNDYYTKAAVDTLVGARIGLALASYPTTTQVNTALAANATESTSYVNNLGLGMTTTPSIIANIDVVALASGTYRYSTTTAGTFPAASPASVTGIIQMERFSSAGGRQTLQPTGDRRVFRREMVSGVWGAWSDSILTSPGSLAIPAYQVGYANTGLMSSGGNDFMQAVVNGTIAHTTSKLYGDSYGLATRLDVNGYVAGKRFGGQMQYLANLLAECSGGNAFSVLLGDGVAYSQVVGASFRAVPAGSNTGAATLSLNGAAAVPIRTVTGAVLPAGYIIAGEPVTFTRYSGHWRSSRDTEFIPAPSSVRVVRYDDGTMRYTCAVHQLKPAGDATTGVKVTSVDFGTPFLSTTGLGISLIVLSTDPISRSRVSISNITAGGFDAYYHEAAGFSAAVSGNIVAEGFWY